MEEVGEYLLSATIKDVAELSGVSVATVSKYINGGNLRENYRIPVEKAIKELNYSVNEVARNLKMNRTQMIGILASDISSYYVSDTIKHIQTVLMEKGYIPLILDCQKSQEIEWKQLNVLLRWKVEGIILFPAFNEKELCLKVTEMNIPLVLVDQMIYGIDVDCVTSNNYESAYQITEKLIEAGHTRIGLCRGTVGIFTADERARGYEDAMRQHGLTSLIELGQFTIEGGYEATKHILSSPERPTAVLSCNNHMTIGMLRALTELGMSIPKDISVAAFDKQELDFALPTSLSCVEQPKEKIGRFAAELILKKIENSNSNLEYESNLHALECTLHLTNSIGRI